MNTAKEYKHPGPNATSRQIDHYNVVSPMLDLKIQYGIKDEEIRAELENVLGERITLGKVKSWFRVRLKTGQLWMPEIGVIAVMNQVFKNILTLKGYVFSEGSRIYHEIAWVDKRTPAEEELVRQNRALRFQIIDLEDKLKELTQEKELGNL